MSRHVAKNGLQMQSPRARVSCTPLPENKMKILLAVGLLLLLICSSAQGVKTRCEDVSVYLDDPVNITCYFSEDINQTRPGDFRMYKYDLYSSGTENEVLVLDCFWRDSAECTTAGGYTFDGTVSDRLTVAISRADEKFTGKYECQVLPTDSTRVTQCRLTLKAGAKPTPSPVPTTSATTTEAAGGEDDTNAAAIAVPIILLSIIAAVVVVAVIFRKKILTLFPTLTRFPALLRFWRTWGAERNDPERDSVPKGNPDGSGVHFLDKTTEGHCAEQPAQGMEGRPLLTNEQSVIVPAADPHSSGQEKEENEVFADTFENLADMKTRSNERLAPHDGILPKKSRQDTASSADDTEEETNENLCKASSRDCGGSFHQTSGEAGELLLTQEPLLPVPALFADPQGVEHPDINGVEAVHFKQPIQATGETKNNNTASIESNVEESHPADDGGNDGDYTSTEEHAAVATQEDEEDSAEADAISKQFNKLSHSDNSETTRHNWTL